MATERESICCGLQRWAKRPAAVRVGLPNTAKQLGIGVGRRALDRVPHQNRGWPRPLKQGEYARQCLRLGISGSGTMRMPAASSPSRTALETVTAVGPSPCTQIESTWQGMRLPEVE
jgi:hypothetical protein